MKEIWKDIPGYEGLYQVSDQGKVRSLDRTDSIGRRKTGRIIAPQLNHRGYIRVQLTHNETQKGKYVHLLVMTAFVGPILPGMQCNHIDGNKTNNRIENLEYCTPSENSQHAFKTLKRISNWTGEKHWCAKLTKEDAVRIRKMYATKKYTQKQLAELFNVKQAQISKIILGQRWKS